MGETRREFDRESMRTEALVVRVSGQDGKSVLGESRDVSLKGMFVESSEQLAVGDEVRLFIADERTGTVLRIEAKVVQQRDGGFGVAFVDGSEAARRQIRAFIDGLKKPGDEGAKKPAEPGAGG